MRKVFRFYKKLEDHALRAEHSELGTIESIDKRKRRGERLLTAVASGGWKNNSRRLKEVL